MKRIYLVQNRDKSSKKGFFFYLDSDEQKISHQLEERDIFEDEYSCHSITREELFLMVNNMNEMVESGVEVIKEILKIK